MSFATSCVMREPQNPMDQLTAQTNNLSLQIQKKVPVKTQPTKLDRLVEWGADCVVKTIDNIFLKEVKACLELQAKGKSLNGQVFGLTELTVDGSPVSMEAVTWYRADNVLNTYVPSDFNQKLAAMEKSTNESKILTALYHKSIEKLCLEKNNILRVCLHGCGPQEKGKDAFMYSDLLKVTCLKIVPEITKKL